MPPRVTKRQTTHAGRMGWNGPPFRGASLLVSDQVGSWQTVAHPLFLYAIDPEETADVVCRIF